uniref:Uncharacterized protein n=1 Tax=Anguilla anguilla TaxID=7936 RepID=A0A0E9UJ23_ANGAN
MKGANKLTVCFYCLRQFYVILDTY